MDRNDRNGGTPRARLLVWIVVGAAAAALLIPALIALMVSLKEYRLAEGLAGSPWVGFANYSRVLESPRGAVLIGSGIFYSAFGLAGALAVGVPLGWFVPRIGARWARHTALGAMLVPVFVPAVCWASGILPLLNGGTGSVRLPVLLVGALSGAGLMGFAGAAYEMAYPGRGFLKGIGWVSLLWAFLCLTPDAELLYLVRPQQADVLDTYAFLEGLTDLALGAGAAAFWIKAFLQAACCAILCAGVYWIFFRGRGEPIDTVLRERKEIPFARWAVPVGVLVAMGAVWLGGGQNLVEAGVPLLDTLPFMAVSALLAGFLAFLIAWAAIAALRGCGWTAFCACAALPLALSNPLVGEYLWFRQLGLLNTFVPGVVLSSLNPAWMLLTLLCARLSRLGRLEGRPLWLLALLPACYAMARAWGGVLTPMLAITRTDLYPWGVRLAVQVRQGLYAESGVAAWVDGWTYLGVLLPTLLFAGLGAAALAVYMRPERRAE